VLFLHSDRGLVGIEHLEASSGGSIVPKLQ